MAFRTKKISQMDPKGSNLASTDLLEISELVSGSYVTKSITGAEIIASVPPTSVEWGDIGGTLSSQTDLNTALSGKVPTTRTLTINGTTQDLSADRTFTVSTGITIGTTTITSGTVGRVLFEGTGNVVQESANLFWDNTNGRLGIGTSSPAKTLSVVGSATSGFDAITFKGQYSETGYLATSNGAIYLASGAGVTGSFLELSSGVANLRGGTTAVTFTVASERMRINNAGNVLINTTTDAGFRLDVNGTARVQTNLDINTGSGLFANGGNNPVVINSNYWSNGDGFVIASKNTTDSSPKLTLRANSAGACSLQLYNNGNKSYIRQINTSGVGGQSVYLFQLDNRQAKLAVTSDDSTTDASFFGKAIWDGGAAATFRASSATQTANIINVQNHDGTSTFLNVKPTGNVLINTTTDAGYKLDVNGTARFGNVFQATNANSITAGYEGGFVLSGGVGSLKRDTTGYLKTLLDCGYDGGLRIRPYSAGFTSYVDVRSDTSAALTVTSTNQGFLPPRMTTTQKNAIASPATGLMVYDTTLNVITYYNGTTWI